CARHPEHYDSGFSTFDYW
nr:immunoglobulin heavy chain junction region [Macaca mulatta]MOW45928.1 immunoglobulin heavy chain junction region [Macaca mulatta]MOW46016.1 immunoglobulin heavy chain junction region [Macaca mulatta]MOW46357.1 immunoglobulin heavy chain junction region [Macaca mulatta]MOW49185.1 immunoglobulin heavy chain junction region [Macaca mulatta]